MACMLCVLAQRAPQGWQQNLLLVPSGWVNTAYHTTGCCWNCTRAIKELGTNTGSKSLSSWVDSTSAHGPAFEITLVSGLCIPALIE